MDQSQARRLVVLGAVDQEHGRFDVDALERRPAAEPRPGLPATGSLDRRDADVAQFDPRFVVVVAVKARQRDFLAVLDAHQPPAGLVQVEGLSLQRRQADHVAAVLGQGDKGPMVLVRRTGRGRVARDAGLGRSASQEVHRLAEFAQRREQVLLVGNLPDDVKANDTLQTGQPGKHVGVAHGVRVGLAPEGLGPGGGGRIAFGTVGRDEFQEPLTPAGKLRQCGRGRRLALLDENPQDRLAVCVQEVRQNAHPTVPTVGGDSDSRAAPVRKRHDAARFAVTLPHGRGSVRHGRGSVCGGSVPADQVRTLAAGLFIRPSPARLYCVNPF